MIRHDPFDDNLVLATLDTAARRRLSPHIREQKLQLGQYLESGSEKSQNIYFPLSGIVSLVLIMEDGRTGEIAIIGREGLVGSSLFVTGKPPNSEAVVQVAGLALVLPRSIVLEEVKRNERFNRALVNYSQGLTAQIAQTALCNRHHQIEQQLARWLLMSLDRLVSREVAMTQDLIANMLGVRREGISGAAHALQEDGVIAYSRGRIRVLDRDALLTRSCECYEAIREHYDKLNVT